VANYIYSLILLIIALVCIELRKSYHSVPKAELKKQAKAGDALADRIYHAVSYEESLETLLWLVIILCAAGSLILFNRVAPLWLDFIAIVLFIWIAFAWLPKRRMDRFSLRLASIFSPVIVWLLNYLHPLFRKVNHFGSKTINIHTGVYDKKDLIKLVEAQKKQADNRVEPRDLDLIRKGLKLSDKTVGDYYVSWSKIHHTLAHEAVGPILLDELHKSGQLFVPVLEDNQTKKVVGIISLDGLDISKVGEVKDLMNQNIHYLREDDSLFRAFEAIAATGSPVFIVLDKKDRLTGIITLKDVMNQLVTFEPKVKVVKPDNKEES